MATKRIPRIYDSREHPPGTRMAEVVPPHARGITWWEYVDLLCEQWKRERLQIAKKEKQCEQKELKTGGLFG